MSSSNNISISEPETNSNNIDNIKYSNKRCIAYNKNGKLCRSKIKNNQLFCCLSHNQINDDILKGCFICMENINDINEIIYLKCHHAFHKECYLEWLGVSTYENPICLLCREEIIKHTPQKIRKSNVIMYNAIDERLSKLNKLYQNIIHIK